jgi:hypothetical protein
VDWAPDFVVDDVAELLRTAGVRATWFVTHESPAIERLRGDPELFELGIHPNLLEGSTHGGAPEEVFETLLRIVPDARSLRTHGVVQSGQLFAIIIEETPLTIDSSTFLPGLPNIGPVRQWWKARSLLRIPFFWSDDHEMCKPSASWDASELTAVLAFHPIHLYLNSRDLDGYDEVKRAAPLLADVPQETLDPHVQRRAGTRTLFVELLERLSGSASRRLDEVADAYETNARASG